MKHLVYGLLFFSVFGLSNNVFAEGFALKQGDTIQKILEDRKGKQVTLRLSDGGELTGRILAVTKELVLLSELAGREYFQGIIDSSKVTAVIIRTKE